MSGGIGPGEFEGPEPTDAETRAGVRMWLTGMAVLCSLGAVVWACSFIGLI